MRRIKIIETFMQGKAGEEACEDAYFISEDFAAVIDGVSSKSKFRFENKSTGRLAAELVRGVLEKLPPESTADAFITAVDQGFDRFYDVVAFPDDRAEKGLQAVCVVYSAKRRELWLIGDCQALLDGKLYSNQKKSDLILSELRALDIACLKKIHPEQSRADRLQEAREAIVPWILKATCFANDAASPYGYSVLNGEPVPAELIEIISLDGSAHEIVLASDGYPELMDSLKESEEKLHKLLEEDPGCYKRYHTTKGLKQGCESFDDRTYLRFTVEAVRSEETEKEQNL